MSYILDAMKKNNAQDSTEDVPDLNSQHQQAAIEPQAKGLKKWLIGFAIIIVIAAFGFLINKAYFQNSPQLIVSESQNSQQNNEPTQTSTDSSLREVQQSTLKKETALISEQQATIVGSKDVQIAQQPVAIKDAVVTKVAVMTPKKSIKSVDNIQVVAKTSDSKLNDASGTEAELQNGAKPNSTREQTTQADYNQLPTMTYTTHIYAKEEKDRFVMLNGKLYVTGNRVAKDLFLQQILEQQIIMKYKGQLYKVPAFTNIE